MTDELTPEEKEAFDKLTRERMPVAGLEERVVGAMRERGFLAKRRRAIELTGGRVAGVLAASVALMFGAYSIGLHRGGGEEALRSVAPIGTQAPGALAPTPAPTEEVVEQGRVQTPPVDADKPASQRLEPQDALKTEGLAKERSRSNEAQPADQAQAPAPLTAEERSDESKKDLVWQLTPTEEEQATAQKSTASDAVAPRAEPTRAPSRIVVPQMSAAPETTTRPFTFLLDGKKVVIEAPDSVRVVEDKQGRILLIYTSDGVIRIRMTD
jgi:hypothetical protein